MDGLEHISYKVRIVCNKQNEYIFKDIKDFHKVHKLDYIDINTETLTAKIYNEGISKFSQELVNFLLSTQ